MGKGIKLFFGKLIVNFAEIIGDRVFETEIGDLLMLLIMSRYEHRMRTFKLLQEVFNEQRFASAFGTRNEHAALVVIRIRQHLTHTIIKLKVAFQPREDRGPRLMSTFAKFLLHSANLNIHGRAYK